MVQGGNAWDAQSFDGKFGSKGKQVRDEYFEKDDEGYYQLKDGYEQRYQGENSGSLGAEMVYSNDYDDLEYPEEARYYGIYKIPEPKTVTETVYQDKPVETPEEKALPIQLSNRAAEAIAGTQAYENKMLPRQGDFSISDKQSPAQDFKNSYSINLTNELKEKAPGVLETKAEDIKQKDAYSLNLLK